MKAEFASQVLQRNHFIHAMCTQRKRFNTILQLGLKIVFGVYIFEKLVILTFIIAEPNKYLQFDE